MRDAKKKIALLNFPVDENYGGHLQRYALIKSLSDLGMDVIHLNCRYVHTRRSMYKRIRCNVREALHFIKALIIGECDIHDFPYLKNILCREPKAERFYSRYIPHTKKIYSKEELKQHTIYDAYIVGSDQVWRAPMASYNYGIDTYFFDYLPMNATRYAYGVSLGTNEKYTNEEIARLTPLYCRFKMVSVREKAALEIFKEYGWVNPKAECVLDPTFLLDKAHYVSLVMKAYTKPSNGNMFCYILDENDDKKSKIEQIAKEKKLRPFYISLETNSSIEQWLRAFIDSEFVITDSYHGFVFALIFNKPFYLLYNEKRGNVRFESLMELLEIRGNDKRYDWAIINEKICRQRERSLDYIRQISCS